jgi:2-polyprenyl-3-methyl-5-hydroxy-6-metoxy-1,4-benzoquinol methylase
MRGDGLSVGKEGRKEDICISTALIRNNWNQGAEQKGTPRVYLTSRPWYRYAQELLCRYLPSVESRGAVLDVGCGMGEFLVMLRELGFDAEGLEGNKDQAERVSSLGFAVKIANLEEKLPYPGETFSLVTCLEVIEHIALAEVLLEEIWRVLKPGGHLVLTTPNFGYLHNRVHYFLGQEPNNEGIHLRFFTRRRLRILLEEAGFQIVGTNSYGPVLLWSTIAARFLKRRFPLWSVGRRWENWLAYDFVYLAVKR